jgi:hypothetical protein
MDIRKTIILLISLHITAGLVCGRWQDDLRSFLENKEYDEAKEYAAHQFEKVDELFHPLLCQVVAYCSFQLDDRQDELRWMATSFEGYTWGDAATSYVRDFLDPGMTPFVISWRQKYPFLRDISLTQRENPAEGILPSKLVMEITLDIVVYFKLYHDSEVVKGGVFQKGRNMISINTNGLFKKSGQHDFMLELKSGDLLVKKKITLDIVMDSSPQDSTSLDELVEKEYKVSLYYGDLLLATHQKKETFSLSDRMKLPASAFESERFNPSDQPNPLENSFSILSAAGLAYQLVKGLIQKNKEERGPKNPLQRVKSMAIHFRTQSLQGEERRNQALVILQTDHVSPPLHRNLRNHD